MSNHTTNLKTHKKCSQGEDCIHPKGPVLPRTREYFYFSNGKAQARCIECQKKYRREHHERNREHDNARSREYAAKHKGRYELYRQNYHIRKAKAVNESYSVADLDVIYKSQQGRCWWCQDFVGLKFEIDHRIPLSRGGKDILNNIVISCGACNRGKKDKLPHEWNGRLL